MNPTNHCFIDQDIKDQFVKVVCIDQTNDKPYSNAPTEDFLIGKYLVTIAHWNRVRSWAVQNGYDLPFGHVAKHGYQFDNPEILCLPVSCISFFDACKWCNAKSEMENLKPSYFVNGKIFKIGKTEFSNIEAVEQMSGYRLPTGKEWEWAASGGVFQSDAKYSGGDNFHDVGLEAPFFGDKQEPHGVGEKLPNDLEIYDMSGLSWEWCFEQKNGLAMLRGGWRENNRFDKPSQDLSVFEVKTFDYKSPEIREAGNGLRIVKILEASISASKPKDMPTAGDCIS